MLTRCKRVRGFGSALLRYELAWDGARGFGVVLLRHELVWGGVKGFGIGKGCLGRLLNLYHHHLPWESPSPHPSISAIAVMQLDAVTSPSHRLAIASTPYIALAMPTIKQQIEKGQWGHTGVPLVSWSVACRELRVSSC